MAVNMLIKTPRNRVTAKPTMILAPKLLPSWIGDQQYSYSALQIQSLFYLKWMMNAKPGNMQAGVTRPVDIGCAGRQDKDEQEQCQCFSSQGVAFYDFLY